MPLTVGDMRGVEGALDGVWRAPLGADHDVVTRLVPEVVVELGDVLLPRSCDLQRLAIDQNEGACDVTTQIVVYSL